MTAIAPLLVLAVLETAPAPSPAPAAGTPAARPAPPAEAAPLRALRTQESIAVDGVLSESVWQNAEPFTALIQRDPVEGRPVSQRTEVRVAYDDDAIYVGARLYDTAPDSIQVRLARRDASIASDRFGVYLVCLPRLTQVNNLDQRLIRQRFCQRLQLRT